MAGSARSLYSFHATCTLRSTACPAGKRRWFPRISRCSSLDRLRCPFLGQRWTSELHACSFFRHRCRPKGQRCRSERQRCSFFRQHWSHERQACRFFRQRCRSDRHACPKKGQRCRFPLLRTRKKLHRCSFSPGCPTGARKNRQHMKKARSHEGLLGGDRAFHAGDFAGNLLVLVNGRVWLAVASPTPEAYARARYRRVKGGAVRRKPARPKPMATSRVRFAHSDRRRARSGCAR